MSLEKATLTSSWRTWLGFACVISTYFMGYGLLVFPSSINHLLITSLHIDDVQVGMLSSAFLITYVLLQIPSGIILDIFPVKRVILIAVLGMALGCFLMASTNNYSVILISRLVMGASAAFTFIACLTYGRIYFIISLFPLIAGISEMMSGLGGVVFNTTFSALSKLQPWHNIIMEIGSVILLLGICIVLFTQQSHKFTYKKAYPIKTQFLLMMRRKRILLAALYTGLVYAHYMVLTNTWSITFLKMTYHSSPSTAIWTNAMTMIGFTVGCPLIGILTRYFERMKLLLFFTIAQAILLILTVHFGLALSLERIILFTLGFATGSIILVFDIVKTYVPRQVYGMTSGMINMFFGGMGIIITPLVGYILQRTNDTHAAALPVVACSGLAVLCCFLMYLIDHNIPLKKPKPLHH
ncbi:MAG: MFS transporter [Coxiellaceae bacterium]|nr:MFS transporter [Coxiellaceae bacterium]